MTSDSPSTSAPAAWAAIASCTVDMPTRSAPSVRIIRISAGVSKCGPGTPGVDALGERAGRPRGRARAAARLYRSDRSTNCGPTSGERPVRLRWSEISTRSPSPYAGSSPPAALVSTTVGRRAATAVRTPCTTTDEVVALVGVHPAEEDQDLQRSRSAPTGRFRRGPRPTAREAPDRSSAPRPRPSPSASAAALQPEPSTTAASCRSTPVSSASRRAEATDVRGSVGGGCVTTAEATGRRQVGRGPSDARGPALRTIWRMRCGRSDPAGRACLSAARIQVG